MKTVSIPAKLPLIALKNIVLFPKIAVPLVIQRQKSVNSLNTALAGDRLVMFVTQKNIDDAITEKDMFRIGTVGRISSVAKLPDGSYRVDVEGITRAKVTTFIDGPESMQANIGHLALIRSEGDTKEQAVLINVIEQMKKIAELRSFSALLPDAINMISQLRDIEQVITLVAVNLNLEIQDQQAVLEEENAVKALEQLSVFLSRELDILDAEKNITKETKKKIGKMQKELFLREQLKSIEKELGVEDEKEEFEILKRKIDSVHMPKEVHAKAVKELNRLTRMPAFSPEVSYLRTYLDWLVELPWIAKTKEKIDLKAAEKILNEDHYGLRKVKERILEYLAVQKQVGHMKGPILCLAGPPGTGKTSVGQSIAKALGRKFVRVSLGGLRDEAEIRGHRKTYVGAMPGRIIQGIHTAKSANPVFMLDEIDKIGMDFRGDPSAALLEALDPQQNHAFSDHYLELPFDLSNVFFIATANQMETIPPALRDRLEVIEFPGYTEDEKLHIAKNFLLPKLMTEHGLKKKIMAFNDAALSDVISNHTREAGVRELNRQLAAITRKVTRQLIESPSSRQVSINKKDIHKYLGPVKYTHQTGEEKNEVGVVTGLGWTPVGGEVFPIEVTKMPGKGRLILTGQLGSVMKESAQAALSYARAKAAKYGVKESFSADDIHIHVPSAAIKKDGPSAGIAITTALISMFLQKPVDRRVCMTGEVTLRGKVMEIGGLKEKLLAAHRAGLKIAVLPQENKKDLEDLPKDVKRDMKLYFVHTMDDVLKIALK